MVKLLVDLLYSLVDSQFEAWVWIAIDTFSMSKESNKHFFIFRKNLYQVFATGNIRSI